VSFSKKGPLEETTKGKKKRTGEGTGSKGREKKAKERSLLLWE
jgi:hypothetical protein